MKTRLSAFVFKELWSRKMTLKFLNTVSVSRQNEMTVCNQKKLREKIFNKKQQKNLAFLFYL